MDRRFRFEEYKFIYMDGDGYCTVFYFKISVEELKLRRVVAKDEGDIT